MLLKKKIKKKNLKKISIKIIQNNVFCTFTNLFFNKILYSTSSGKANIAISKNKQRYNSYLIINLFFDKIKKYLTDSHYILELTVPVIFRYSIMKRISKYFTRKKLYIFLNPQKVYNGCKVKKFRRTGKKKNIKLLKN
jgi:hypothetical protein